MKSPSGILKLAGTAGKAMLWRSGLRLGRLSGLQRFLVSAIRGRTDRIPPALGEHSTMMPTLHRIGAWEYLNYPQLAVELEIGFCEEFGFDADLSATGTYIKFGCGPEIGTKWQ